MSESEARSLFLLAGFVVLRVWALIDGYGYSPDDERYFDTKPRQVWWLVKTQHGLIQIGWRKRVINIDWSDTGSRVIVTSDDVTKDETRVHAWSTTKALEYLTALRLTLESAQSVGAVDPVPASSLSPSTREKPLQGSFNDNYGAALEQDIIPY